MNVGNGGRRAQIIDTFCSAAGDRIGSTRRLKRQQHNNNNGSTESQQNNLTVENPFGFMAMGMANDEFRSRSSTSCSMLTNGRRSNNSNTVIYKYTVHKPGEKPKKDGLVMRIERLKWGEGGYFI
jgi:hypothetical protein